MKKLIVLAFLFLAIAGFQIATSLFGNKPLILSRGVIVDGEIYNYKVAIPKNFDGAENFPIILFLHGIGESGDDNRSQIEKSAGRALLRQNFPAIIVFPQCRETYFWTDPEMEKMAIAALRQSIIEFGGDVNRIYLTGTSMGGYGTWSLAYRYPKHFAAVVPICGGIKSIFIKSRRVTIPAVNDSTNPYSDVAWKIGATPVFTFHGTKDDIVPVSEQRLMVQAFASMGKNIIAVEYENLSHQIWEQAYADPRLRIWLFNQNLRNQK